MKKVMIILAIATMFVVASCDGNKNEVKEKAIQDSIYAKKSLDSLAVITAKNDSIALVVAKQDSIKKSDSIAKLIKKGKVVIKKTIKK